jgi:plastocyanin
MKLSMLCAIGSLVLFGVAQAGDLRVTVNTPSGAPVQNAVVSVYPADGEAAVRPSPETLVMSQKDIAFSPYVLVVPVGSAVEFPNRDNVRHHVYSFSPPHRFELRLYGKEEKRVETFDKPGIVALGCNIHDKMAGFIDVVDTRFAAKTDAQGVAVITGLPAGALKITTWHPLSKAAGGVVETSVAGGSSASVVVDLRAPPPHKQTN